MKNSKIIFPEKLYGINGFKVNEYFFVKQTSIQFAIYYLTINKPVSIFYSNNINKFLCDLKELYKTEKQALIILKKNCEKSIKYIDKKLKSGGI